MTDGLPSADDQSPAQIRELIDSSSVCPRKFSGRYPFDLTIDPALNAQFDAFIDFHIAVNA